MGKCKIKKLNQIRILKKFDGEIMTSKEIKKIFGFSENTYIYDTWLSWDNHFKEVGRKRGTSAFLYKLIYNKQIH